MANQIKWNSVDFSVGDTIKVQQTVTEGDKTRTQNFQGIVIAIRGKGERKNFIVRRIAAGGIGVEKIFPIETPTVTGIQVIKKGKVRRAKLYYLRKLTGKKATKVKDVFVKKTPGVALEETVVKAKTKAATQEKEEETEKPEAQKVKNIVQPAPEKKKKVKKGPKKIVRKERKFVR